MTIPIWKPRTQLRSPDKDIFEKIYRKKLHQDSFTPWTAGTPFMSEICNITNIIVMPHFDHNRDFSSKWHPMLLNWYLLRIDSIYLSTSVPSYCLPSKHMQNIEASTLISAFLIQFNLYILNTDNDFSHFGLRLFLFSATLIIFIFIFLESKGKN